MPMASAISSLVFESSAPGAMAAVGELREAGRDVRHAGPHGGHAAVGLVDEVVPVRGRHRAANSLSVAGTGGSPVAGRAD